MIVLGIESSCDETAVALVEDGRKVLGQVIRSQIDTHKIYGGVVPEIASRQHLEAIHPLLDTLFHDTGKTLEDVDLIAATRGPGLVGALLVGLSSARALALAKNIPFVGVNHMEGHIAANALSHPDLKPPFVALVVSGGHTYLLDVSDWTEMTLYGRTVDDACGEAYDKVARAIGLGYPGGPVVDRLAAEGRDVFDFPRVRLEKDGYDFSFSGLKTAVINRLHQAEQKGEDLDPKDVCASFQAAVIDVLVEKTMALLEETKRDALVVAGGVSANRGLRSALEKACQARGISLYAPDFQYCTDNAAMIAAAGYFDFISGTYDTTGHVDPNLGLC